MGNMESKCVRVESLQRVFHLLCDEAEGSLPDAHLNAAFAHVFKPLLRRFSDEAESCRELSVRLVAKYITVCEDIDYALPYLFPALMERCSKSFDVDFTTNQFFRVDTSDHEDRLRGRAVPLPDAGQIYRHTVAEPSEEVRKLLCDLLATVLDTVVEREAFAVLGPYFHDTIVFLHASAVDPYPALKVAALMQLKRLAASERFANTMHHYCPALVKAVMPSLRHRHAKVRAVCVEAVEALVLCPNKNKCKGGGSDAIVDLVGYREENVIPICAFYTGETRINYFGSLVGDRSVAVRRVFYAMLSKWMTTMLDRWDHSGRLLPFLLTGLTDQVQEIQQLTLDTLDKLGRQYEEEHAEEVVEKKQLGVDGPQARANYAKPLPQPWIQRPRIGTRLYVRSNARNFIFTVMRELGDWRQETKRSSVKLFKVCLVYLEEHVTMEAHKIVKTLLDVYRDEDLRPEIAEAAELAGRYIEPQTYLHLLCPIIKGETGAEAVCWDQRINAIYVLAHMMAGSKASILLDHFLQVFGVLSTKELLSFASVHERLEVALIDSVTCLLSKAAEKGRSGLDATFVKAGQIGQIEKALEQLYQVLLKLQVHQDHRAFGCLARLQFDVASGQKVSVQKLHSFQFPGLLLNPELDFHTLARYAQLNPRMWRALGDDEAALLEYVRICLKHMNTARDVRWKDAADLLLEALETIAMQTSLQQVTTLSPEHLRDVSPDDVETIRSFLKSCLKRGILTGEVLQELRVMSEENGTTSSNVVDADIKKDVLSALDRLPSLDSNAQPTLERADGSCDKSILHPTEELALEGTSKTSVDIESEMP